MALLNESALRAVMGEHAKRNGRRVQERRKALGIRQVEMAEMTGLTQQAISHIELGVYQPRDHVKVMLAAALACAVGDLFPHPDRVEIATLVKAAAA